MALRLLLLCIAGAVLATKSPGTGFTTLEAAASFLGVSVGNLTTEVPTVNASQSNASNWHWSNKLPASMWATCSHTFCKMESRHCTVNKHPSSHSRNDGSWCPTMLTMRVYHNGRENMGRAHHCHVPSHQNDGECFCECAHESVLDRLGDMFSGLTVAGQTRCTHPSLWAAGKKCSGNELEGNPHNLTSSQVDDSYAHNLMVELGVHKDDPTSPHFCQYLCEDLGASCVRFNKLTGKCQCFDGAAQADSSWGNGDFVDASCASTDSLEHVLDMDAALYWYDMSRNYGSEWGKKRSEYLTTYHNTHGGWH